jgi:hypothetical protein
LCDHLWLLKVAWRCIRTAESFPEADSEGGGVGAGSDSASTVPRIMLHRALSSTTTNECVVCMENQIDTVLIHGDNGHMCVCNTCARLLKDCPICRKPVEKAVFVFKQ